MHPANHQDFINLYLAGRVVAGVDNSVALRLVESLPKQYRYAHTFWSWIWILSFPACIAASILIKWWLGILLILIVPGIIRGAITKSAANYVLQHATDDEIFYQWLIDQNLLVFKWK